MGQTLNSTIWLSFPVPKMPTSEKLTYGMLIDADNNENTGVQGVDYIIEIRWEDKQWTRTFSEISSHLEIRTLDEQTNYHGFSENGKRFALIDANLESMGSPEKI